MSLARKRLQPEPTLAARERRLTSADETRAASLRRSPGSGPARDGPIHTWGELVTDADPPIKTVVLDFEGVNFVDSQASDAIGKIIDLAGYDDIDIRLA